jgi:heme/copper-type cytochrome/quinol oxidase subunit 1
MFGSPLMLGLLAYVGALAAAVCAALAAVDPLNLVGTTWADGLAKLVGAAALLGAIGGLQYWGARIWGRTPTEGLMLLALLLLAAGGAAFAVPELVAGGLGQVPLDIVGEVEVIEDPFEALNGVMAAGAAALGLGVILTLLAIVPAARRGAAKPTEARWTGPTLEWAAIGVPALAGSREPVAEVRSATPLLDDAEPATTDATTGELN